MKKLLTTIFALILAVTMVEAASVATVANGNWDDPSTWSGDQVPVPTDNVVIRHRITHSGEITVSKGASLVIEKGAMLSMSGKLWVYGTLTNHDSLEFHVLENLGTFTNTGYMHCVGNYINRKGANMYHTGHMDMEGELMQEGFLDITGTVYIQGDLENRGETYSPPGKSGRFDVCGNAKHYPNAIVTNVVFLCMHCNGIYVRHTGAIADFNLDCSAFPIVLEDFQATPQGPGTVLITWRTASESNSRWFVIERANAGNDETCSVGKCSNPVEFTEVGRVEAAGNSTSPRSYRFTDREAPAGMNFYRLRMVDADGTESASYVVEVVLAEGKAVLQAYPNPTNEVLHIRILEQQSAEAQVSMYAIDGRQIWKQSIMVNSGVGEMDVQVCEFAAGVYILEYRRGDQKLTKKVVFQK